MKYFELKCTAYLKKDIAFKESFNIFSKYISYAMAQDTQLQKLHNTQGFKHYNFGGLLPIEKNKTYVQGKTYGFVLRSLSEDFIKVLSIKLRQNIDNPHLLIISAEKRSIKQFFISELYSATPVVVTMSDGRFWVKEDDLMTLHKQLQDNLEKKYQDFYDEKIEASQSFIQLFELKNKFLQAIPTDKTHSHGKPVNFYGNKFRILPNEDEVSQKLAFIALACGLGEKNSFGAGFCLGKGIK